MRKTSKLKDFDNINDYQKISGYDEAGRGCIAGPMVFVSLVINRDYRNDYINDSKKLSSKMRNILFDDIMNNIIKSNIYIVNNDEIDKKGLKNVLDEYIKKTHSWMIANSDIALLDYVPNIKPGPKTLVIKKGDSKSFVIACASIVAKVIKDKQLLSVCDNDNDIYGWKNNKGYCTLDHINKIKKYGLSRYHRHSFNIK